MYLEIVYKKRILNIWKRAATTNTTILDEIRYNIFKENTRIQQKTGIGYPFVIAMCKQDDGQEYVMCMINHRCVHPDMKPRYMD